MDHLARHAKAIGYGSHIHVRVAQIVLNKVAGLNHPASRRSCDSPIVNPTIGMVVINHHRHRQLQSGHVPECRRPKNKGTVPDHTDHLLFGSRQLDSGGRSYSGAQVGSIVEEQFPPTQWIEVKTVQPDRARFMNDDGILIGVLRNLMSHTIGN